MSAFGKPDTDPLYLEEIESGIGLVTMNRPERLNALNAEMIEAFEGLYKHLTEDKDIRVVILTGAGRGFCSGADLVEAMTKADQEIFSTAWNFFSNAQEQFGNLTIGMRRIPQPVIAAVNGPAAGGGFGLALASDIRIAAPPAYFLASFINLGLSAGEMGTSYILPRLVGMGRASEILFTGRRVDAPEAERIGLVSRIVPTETLVQEATTIARTLLQKTSGGLYLTKRALDSNASAPSLEAAIDLENRNQTIMAVSNDFYLQVRKFAEKG
jgi:enoyl-CoA hydratase